MLAIDSNCTFHVHVVYVATKAMLIVRPKGQEANQLTRKEILVDHCKHLDICCRVLMAKVHILPDRILPTVLEGARPASHGRFLNCDKV